MLVLGGQIAEVGWRGVCGLRTQTAEWAADTGYQEQRQRMAYQKHRACRRWQLWSLPNSTNGAMADVGSFLGHCWWRRRLQSSQRTSQDQHRETGYEMPGLTSGGSVDAETGSVAAWKSVLKNLPVWSVCLGPIFRRDAARVWGSIHWEDPVFCQVPGADAPEQLGVCRGVEHGAGGCVCGDVEHGGFADLWVLPAHSVPSLSPRPRVLSCVFVFAK